MFPLLLVLFLPLLSTEAVNVQDSFAEAGLVNDLKILAPEKQLEVMSRLPLWATYSAGNGDQGVSCPGYLSWTLPSCSWRQPGRERSKKDSKHKAGGSLQGAAVYCW